MRAQYGYMGKMLFVDLTDGSTHEEDLTEDLARDFVGGYGIGARLIYERMRQGADPLGPENILAIGSGPFTGCGTASTSRFITMGKSPLTGYWGDSNCGGDFAPALKGACHDSLDYYPLRELMGAITGWEATVEDLVKTGTRISTMLHAFNIRESFEPDRFRMPDRAAGDPQFTVGPFKDRTIDFEELKKEYYKAMGFDVATSAIAQDRITQLGLGDIIG